MKTSIRLLSLVLALALCVSLMAGCQTNTDPKDTTAPTDTTASTDSTPSELKNTDIYPLDTDTELEVMIINASSTPYEGRELVNTWENATGVHINWKEISDVGSYTTAIAGNDWPDLCLYGSRGFDKAKMYEYGQAGKVINFVDYKDIMPNLWYQIENNPGAFETVVNEDGSIYSLPQLSATTTTPSPIYFRTDMAEAAGLSEVPETTDEFLAWLQSWQDYYGKDGAEFYSIIPYSPECMGYQGNMANFFFPSFGELVRTNLHEHNGKIVLGAATEQYKHYLEFMKEMYNTPGFYQEAFIGDPNYTKGLIAEGKTGIATTMTHLTLDAFPSGKFDIYGLKPLTSEYNSTPHYYRTYAASWNNCWISTECEDIETACRWLDAFFAPKEDPLNDEGTIWGLTVWKGELGKNFELVNDETGLSSYCPEGYATALAWITSNYITASYVGDVPYIEVNDSALSRKSFIVGELLNPYAQDWGKIEFITLNADDQDTYATAWTDIDKYLASCHVAFIIGEMDIEDDWDTYISTLNKMGLQDIIDIYQNAYDAMNT